MEIMNDLAISGDSLRYHRGFQGQAHSPGVDEGIDLIVITCTNSIMEGLRDLHDQCARNDYRRPKQPHDQDNGPRDHADQAPLVFFLGAGGHWPQPDHDSN